MTRPKDLDSKPMPGTRDWGPTYAKVAYILWALFFAFVGYEAGRVEVAGLAHSAFEREAHAYRLLDGLLEPCSASLSMVLREDKRLHQQITETHPDLIPAIMLTRTVQTEDR